MKLVKTFGRTAKTAAALVEALEQRGSVNTAKVEQTVAAIIDDVRLHGDAGLRTYAARFDGLAANAPLLVSPAEMKAAWDATAPALKTAMKLAQANIRAFAEAQMPAEWNLSPTTGVSTGQIVRPLASVGCYVPGGRYPLPSTLLMTVTPAQVAGVERIVVHAVADRAVQYAYHRFESASAAICDTWLPLSTRRLSSRHEAS